MSYKINKTNGDLIVELADGQIDSTSTDITLIGKNYRGFGELFNENFVKMLENFSSTSPPSAPLEGQLWYDASDGRLKLYNGEIFRIAGGPIISSTQPSMVAGDLWIDNDNNKLYFFDGTDVQLVGPSWDSRQQKSDFEVVSVIDTTGKEKVVIKLFLGGDLVGIYAKEEFRLSGTNKIDSYPDDPADTIIPPRQLLQPGFNVVSSDFWYRGTASSTRALVDEDGTIRTAANFLPTDDDCVTTGTMTIKDRNGLSLNVDDIPYALLKIVGETTTIETQQSNTDFVLRARKGNQYLPSVYVDSSAERVGIYTDTPDYTLDVSGDVRTTGNAIIEGNLTVKGDATYFNVSKLTVQDKNIELGLLDDSTEGVDADVDGAGIIIRSTDGSKDWVWEENDSLGNPLNAWTSNVNINLIEGSSLKIDGTPVLTKTALGNTIVSAPNLTQIGNLSRLVVDDIEIDGNTIAVTDPLNITSTSNIINVNNSRIKKLLDPRNDPSDPVEYAEGAQDAATRQYVDRGVATERIVFSLDITGLADPNNDVLAILEDMYPASVAANDKEAKIHCTSYAGTTVSGIDVEAALTKSTVSVTVDPQDSTTPSFETVLQDIAFTTVSGSATLNPSRETRLYKIESGAWVWKNTTTYTP